MKKIILWGDGLLAGPAGFGEFLVDHIFLHHPRADVAPSVIGGDGISLQDVAREMPMRVIGKAPDLVLLGFGSSDLSAGRSPEEMVRQLSAAVSVAREKTSARIVLLSPVASFFSEGPERERCRAYLRGLAGLAADRVTPLDLEAPVEAYLAEHRQSPGEKRSLHLAASRLTPLGRLFLAHHAYRLVPWPEW